MRRQKPIVACDADGVIVDWYTLFVRYVNAKTGAKIRVSQINDHNFETVWGISLEQMFEMVTEFYILHPVEHLPALKAAIDTINELSKKFDFVIITSRSETYREATFTWFNKHLPGIKIYFSHGANNPYAGGKGRKTKLEIAKSLGARYFIEDNPYEFDGWEHDHVIPICFKQPWNKHVKNVRRMDWGQIKDFLLKDSI